MINKENYFAELKKLPVKPSFFPEGLKKFYDYIKDASDNHTDWEFYDTDKDMKKKVDEYFRALSKFIGMEDEKKAAEITGKQKYSIKEKEAREAAKEFIYKHVENGESVSEIRNRHAGYFGADLRLSITGSQIHVTRIKKIDVDFSFPLQSIYNEIKDELEKSTPAKSKKTPKQKHSKPNPVKSPPSKPAKARPAYEKIKTVEKIEEQVTFIKRYANMQGKEKTETQMLHFLSALQKAITERRIRKTSAYRKEIEYIQDNLVAQINRMQKIPKPEDRFVKVRIEPSVYEKFVGIGKSEQLRPSVGYLKRYVGIQGKQVSKDKAERLIKVIDKAAKEGKILSNDLYAGRMKDIYKSLNHFVKIAKPNESLEIHEAALNGLNGVLGCGCDEKKKEAPKQAPDNSLRPEHKHTVMNSLDFAKLKFETLGFTGKWLKLIGDPCSGFTAMVFGRPKMGKSYLCVDWAGYLARHHGETLYVAREEQLNGTLQKKLNDKDVQHRSLFVSDHLPEDLSPYEYIFLDSVNKLGLSPQDLERLKEENPGKSFIDVHQTTKEGKFRGTNEYQHDVDIVIEVPEKGRAVQFGRFNQGGEIPIFDQDHQLCEEDDLPMAA